MKNVFFLLVFKEKTTAQIEMTSCVAVTFMLKSYLSKCGTSRLWVDQCKLSLFSKQQGVWQRTREEERTQASENRVGAAVGLNADGPFYLLLGRRLLQEQICGRGFNYWRQHSAPRAVGNARAFTVRGQNLWQFDIFITRDIFFKLH